MSQPALPVATPRPPSLAPVEPRSPLAAALTGAATAEAANETTAASEPPPRAASEPPGPASGPPARAASEPPTPSASDPAPGPAGEPGSRSASEPPARPAPQPASELPPRSASEPPARAASEPPARPVVPAKPKPLLASDALREELAPWAPLTRAGRRLTAAGAGVLLVGSALLGVSGGAPGAIGAGVEGALLSLGVLVVLPLGYARRAAATAALGALVLVLGLFGHGPAGALVRGPGAALPWEVARVLAAALLPAALMLRAHYRAFARTRLLLGWGLVLALPFVMRSGYLVLLGPSWVERIAAASSVASVLLALLGFMGSHTTAGGSLWAAFVLGSLALDIATRAALTLEPSWQVEYLVTAASFLVGAGLTALGLFQSLAHLFAPDARRAVDERCRRRGLAHF